MKLALVFLLVTVGDCKSILSGLLDLPNTLDPSNLLASLNLQNITNELLLNLTNCLTTALTKDFADTSTLFGEFLCPDAQQGQLDVAKSEKASENFIQGMYHLGCVKPLANITGSATTIVEAVKTEAIKALAKDPLGVAAVKALCPAGVLLQLYGSLFSDQGVE